MKEIASLAFLTDREREIVTLHDSGLSFTAIGERINASKGRAQQIHARAFRKLTRASSLQAAHKQRQSLTRVDILSQKVTVLGLSVRSENCVLNARCQYIGDLVQRTDEQLLKSRNIGHRVLKEVQEALAVWDLHLNMNVISWQRPKLAEVEE